MAAQQNSSAQPQARRFVTQMTRPSIRFVVQQQQSPQNKTTNQRMLPMPIVLSTSRLTPQDAENINKMHGKNEFFKLLTD